MRTFTLRKRRHGIPALAAAGMLILSSPSGHAFGTEVEDGFNCVPGWTAEFPDGRLSGTGLIHVRTLATLTVGDETSLFASGVFRYAGGVLVSNIARWDGRSWSPLGKGFAPPEVARSMTAFDEGLGRGPALFVGGLAFHTGDLALQGIARWDGTSWSDVDGGVNGNVFALAVFDDGSGPMLYVGGDFTAAGGVPAQRAARWDGRAWRSAGDGLTGGRVRAFATFDSGSGSALYAVQSSPSPADDPTHFLARWDGATWTNVAIFAGSVKSLDVFDDGGGSRLYAAGVFTAVDDVPANHIARWDGRRWSALGAGVDAGIEAMAAVPTSSETVAGVYVGGTFTAAGEEPANRVARWDGKNWWPLNGGCDPYVAAIAAYDDGRGGGESVFVGGLFEHAGGKLIPHLARWDGDDFSRLGNGVGGNCDDESTYNCAGIVHALVSAPTGPEDRSVIYAAGNFDLVGDQDASRVAAWDSSRWSALGSGVNGILMAGLLAEVGDTRPALYVAGEFNQAGGVDTGPIARWAGKRWSALGAPFGGGTIWSMCVPQTGQDAPQRLVVGGSFTSAAGVSARNVAQWDGREWEGFGAGPPNFVYAVAAFQDGLSDEPTLYAGGRFVPSSSGHVVRWDGRKWSTVGIADGPGTHPATVLAMRQFDDGSGPALYVGGSFEAIDGVPALGIARWDGRNWSAVGDGFYGSVFGLSELHDPGIPAPRLVAVGQFVFSGPAGGFNGVARWDGTEWHRFDQGISDDFFVPAGSQPSVRSAAEHRFVASEAPSLFIGGMFQTVGGRSAGGIARWVMCPNPLGAAMSSADLNRDGRVDAADLAVVLAAWGRCDTTGSCPADLDHSGIVDSDDLTILLQRGPRRFRE